MRDPHRIFVLQKFRLVQVCCSSTGIQESADLHDQNLWAAHWDGVCLWTDLKSRELISFWCFLLYNLTMTWCETKQISVISIILCFFQKIFYFFYQMYPFFSISILFVILDTSIFFINSCLLRNLHTVKFVRFRYYSSVSVKRMGLCGHHHSQDGTFRYQSPFMPLLQAGLFSRFHFLAIAAPNPVSIILPFPECHINGIIQYITFSTCFFHFS